MMHENQLMVQVRCGDARVPAPWGAVSCAVGTSCVPGEWVAGQTAECDAAYCQYGLRDLDRCRRRREEGCWARDALVVAGLRAADVVSDELEDTAWYYGGVLCFAFASALLLRFGPRRLAPLAVVGGRGAWLDQEGLWRGK